MEQQIIFNKKGKFKYFILVCGMLSMLSSFQSSMQLESREL